MPEHTIPSRDDETAELSDAIQAAIHAGIPAAGTHPISSARRILSDVMAAVGPVLAARDERIAQLEVELDQLRAHPRSVAGHLDPAIPGGASGTDTPA